MYWHSVPEDCACVHPDVVVISAPMYIDRVPNRNSPPAILLRETHRDGKKTIKRTIANLSRLPESAIEDLTRSLRGEKLVGVEEAFVIDRALEHGHVEAILGSIRKLNLDSIISSKPCRELSLVLAMIVQRLLHASSKAQTARLWHNSTLAEDLELGDADEEDLYEALTWLYERQPRIEKKLAKLHLSEGGMALYDISSSYYEGKTSKLIKYGHSRDGKKGLPVVVYGVATNDKGCPVAVEVFAGNTSDSTTVSGQADTLVERFGLQKVVMVGDRGTLTEPQIKMLKERPEFGWISALRSEAIRALIEEKCLQPSLFDERNLAEISSVEYPGERLVACYNPLLADKRKQKRAELLAATEKALRKLSAEVARRKKKKLTDAEIGVKAGKALGRYKMAKHITYKIEDGMFDWARNEKAIAVEEQLDGIYVIRTSEKNLSPADIVRGYKSLTQVEEAFRGMKGINISVRPIRHRTEEHIRAHIFLCMLTYYVEYHMRKALAPLLFDDEELDQNRATRDAVLPAQPSKSAKQKKRSKLTADGLRVHSFDTLLRELATKTRNTCRLKFSKNTDPITLYPTPTAIQKRAFELLGL
jgi:transposase